MVRGYKREVLSRVGADTYTGQVTGRLILKPSTNTLDRGCPQIRVMVEPLGPGPTDCLGLAG